MKRTLEGLDRKRLQGRTVLVRADLNVPMEAGAVADDQRIRASLPTLRFLREAGARAVVLSHLGRPDGAPDPDFSLAPVGRRLAELLDAPVRFIAASAGAEVDAEVSALEDGAVALLENTRFVAGDTANDPELAQRWAALGDVFVNDAFGTAHRAHASTAGLAEAVRARGGLAVAGFLMARELRFLGDALADPERPFVAILGGAKISGKIDVVSALLPRVDALLIGGAMANTFFLARGLETGASLVEPDRVDMARELMEMAGDKLVLPTDCLVADRVEAGASTRVVKVSAVGPGDAIVDIGPETVQAFGARVRAAATVVWNGPMGVFEVPEFAQGTFAVAEAVAAACDGGALGVIGGGDSAAAIADAGLDDRVTHVSTGGGASLEMLAGRSLPGVDSLSEQE